MTDLSVEQLVVRTGTRIAVNGVSIKIKPGKITALLGPNGAGKSELVLAIAGAMPIASGTITLGENNLGGASVQTIRAAGIAAVPEGHQILAGLSVRDNLAAAGPMLNHDELEQSIVDALETFPELHALMSQAAGSLSGGQQQMVAIAQALICRPKFLLIDEMSLGLAPVIIDRLIGVIRDLRDEGIGILLIEQFTKLALGVADHCYIQSQGRITFAGLPSEPLANPSILETAYLGTSNAAA